MSSILVCYDKKCLSNKTYNMIIENFNLIDFLTAISI